LFSQNLREGSPRNPNTPNRGADLPIEENRNIIRPAIAKYPISLISLTPLLGVRLAVGQRTLDPYAEVRILDPQPDNL
jgi:hypothetical protein